MTLFTWIYRYLRAPLPGSSIADDDGHPLNAITATNATSTIIRSGGHADNTNASFTHIVNDSGSSTSTRRQVNAVVILTDNDNTNTFTTAISSSTSSGSQQQQQQQQPQPWHHHHHIDIINHTTIQFCILNVVISIIAILVNHVWIVEEGNDGSSYKYKKLIIGVFLGWIVIGFGLVYQVFGKNHVFNSFLLLIIALHIFDLTCGNNMMSQTLTTNQYVFVIISLLCVVIVVVVYYERRIKQIKTNYKQRIKQNKTEYEQQLEQVKTEYEQRIEQSKIKLRTELNTKFLHYKKELKQRDKTIQTLQTDLNEERGQSDNTIQTLQERDSTIQTLQSDKVRLEYDLSEARDNLSKALSEKKKLHDFCEKKLRNGVLKKDEDVSKQASK